MIWGDFLLRHITTVFVLELFLAEAMFTMRFRRRKQFPLRAGLSAAAALAASLVIPNATMWLLAEYGFAIVMLVFLVLFLLTIGGMLVCFQCTLLDALFCAIAAYAIQSGLYQLVDILQLLFAFAGVDFFFHRAAALGILLGVHLLIYSAAWLLANHGAKEHYKVNRGALLSLTCLTLVIVLRSLPTAEDVPLAHEISWLFLHILCCALSLYILFEMSENSTLRQELNTMQQMWHMKEEYYELSKEVTESINRKCHDLKYQVEALRRCTGSALDKQALQEIEDAAMIYDAIAKTGNEALDTILTEKSLLCDKNQIQLTYMADGNALDFIQPIDIYVIFGNALDNAIESVLKLASPDQRIITLSAVVQGQLLIVELKNGFDGTLTIENGLPVTSKADGGNHGYGLKSIRLLTRKYGGEMTFSAADSIFSLSLVIPIAR